MGVFIVERRDASINARCIDCTDIPDLQPTDITRIAEYTLRYDPEPGTKLIVKNRGRVFSCIVTTVERGAEAVYRLVCTKEKRG